MASNADIKQHISIDERAKWDKVVVDFANHLGSGGASNHMIGNGTVPGFSLNDYTTQEKNKLAGIEDGALNNPHPATHPYTMITGLSTVAHTGRYPDLLEIPKTFIAGGGNSDTVGGIRFTVGAGAPGAPTNNRDVWFNTNDRLVYVFFNNTWNAMRSVYD